MSVRKVISGHQTGADRGAIDAAIELGLEVGGWVPAGYRDETGQIPRRYWPHVQVTLARSYTVRTELNVDESDATLVLSLGELWDDSGSLLTLRTATKRRRPNLWNRIGVATPSRVREWIDRHRIRTLNVAGPRESSEPGIYQATKDFLTLVLRP